MKTSFLNIGLALSLALAGTHSLGADQSLGEQVSTQVKEKLKGLLKNCTPKEGETLSFTCAPSPTQACAVFNPDLTPAELAANECVTNGVIDHLRIDMSVTSSAATSGHVVFNVFDHHPFEVTYDPSKLVVLFDIGELKSVDAAVSDFISPGSPGGLEFLPNAGQVKLTIERGAQPTVKFEVPVGFDISTTADGGGTLRLKLDVGSEILLGAAASNRSDVGVKLVNAIIQTPGNADNLKPEQKLVADLLSFYAGINEVSEQFELSKIAASNAKIYKDGILNTSITSNGVTDGKIFHKKVGTEGAKISFENTTKIAITVEPQPSPSSSESPLPFTFGTFTSGGLGEGSYVLNADAGTYFQMAPGTIEDAVNTNIAARAYSFNSGTGKWEFVTGFDAEDNPVMTETEEVSNRAEYNFANFLFQMNGMDISINGLSGTATLNKDIGHKITGKFGQVSAIVGGNTMLNINETAGTSNNEINFSPTVEGTSINMSLFFKNHTQLDIAGSSMIKREGVDSIHADFSAGNLWSILKSGGMRVDAGSTTITTAGATPFLETDPCNPGAGTCSVSFGPAP